MSGKDPEIELWATLVTQMARSDERLNQADRSRDEIKSELVALRKALDDSNKANQAQQLELERQRLRQQIIWAIGAVVAAALFQYGIEVVKKAPATLPPPTPTAPGRPNDGRR